VVPNLRRGRWKRERTRYRADRICESALAAEPNDLYLIALVDREPSWLLPKETHDVPLPRLTRALLPTSSRFCGRSSRRRLRFLGRGLVFGERFPGCFFAGDWMSSQQNSSLMCLKSKGKFTEIAFFVLDGLLLHDPSPASPAAVFDCYCFFRLFFCRCFFPLNLL